MSTEEHEAMAYNEVFADWTAVHKERDDLRVEVAALRAENAALREAGDALAERDRAVERAEAAEAALTEATVRGHALTIDVNDMRAERDELLKQREIASEFSRAANIDLQRTLAERDEWREKATQAVADAVRMAQQLQLEHHMDKDDIGAWCEGRHGGHGYGRRASGGRWPCAVREAADAVLDRYTRDGDQDRETAT